MGNIIAAGLRSKLTVLFGSIPGAVVGIEELLNLVDGDAATTFHLKTFAMAVAMAIGFFMAKDANVSGK